MIPADNSLIELEPEEVQDEFWSRGWNDGLPIVPPTPSRVEVMLDAAGVDADEVIGAVPERAKVITANTVAVNAVMAGCAPEYFPIVLAAMTAALDPAMNIHSMTATTGGPALCVVVSGPIAEEVGMNAQGNALGCGNRANATIGRALRLVAINALQSRMGQMDGAVLGTSSKFTLCFAEDEPPEPWTSLRVELGYSAEDSVVVVAATEGPRLVSNHLGKTGDSIAQSLAAAARNPATFATAKAAQAIFVLGPQHADYLRADGWSKSDLRSFILESTRVTPDELAEAGVSADIAAAGVQVPQHPGTDGRFATIRSADDIFIVTAGGYGAGWSAYLSTWPTVHSVAVSRAIYKAGGWANTCTTDACALPAFVPQSS